MKPKPLPLGSGCYHAGVSENIEGVVPFGVSCELADCSVCYADSAALREKRAKWDAAACSRA